MEYEFAKYRLVRELCTIISAMNVGSSESDVGRLIAAVRATLGGEYMDVHRSNTPATVC